MRLRVIKTIFFVSMFLIVLRLGYWQIIRADELAAKAEDQRIVTNEIKAPRGKILFSDNSILAATHPSFLVYTQPTLLKNEVLKESKDKNNENVKLQTELLQTYQKSAASKLANIFWEEDYKLKEKLGETKVLAISTDSAQPKKTDEEIKKEEIEGIEKNIVGALNKDLFWASLGRMVDVNTRKKLEDLNIIGLGFEPRTLRFYPEGSSSAHLLGFVGSDAYGIETGYFGVEGFYNGELKGKKGALIQEKDALGLPILIGKFVQREAKEGKTLVLNIDRTVQTIAEEKLKKGMQKYGAKGGSVVIMEPNSGAVLAMASSPSYDPSIPTKFPSEYYKNPIVADGYEPGSTFKVLVAAAAINEGLVTPETKCDICASPIEMAGFTIRTWNNKYQENATMTDVIVHSDNTGMVFMAKKLGVQKMISYIKSFGFGSLTGVDLQDEASPDLRPDKEWKEIDLATSSFGQGISVTALQVVRAVAAIANGGKIMEPHIVSQIKDQDKTITIKPKVISEPITASAAAQVKEMMIKAVDEGESKFAKPKGYKVAGKTGTAQIAIEGHYDPSKTIASFVGFAPADNPKFVMLVRYVKPSTSIYGAETAAPTFFEIAKELFTYYNIAPTEPF